MTYPRPLSVITATPPGRNPGMLASQVSARWFLQRHGLDHQATFFRLVSMEDRLANLAPGERTDRLKLVDDGIDHHLLLSADQLADTTPLYWGDLLHMRQYLHSIRRLLRSSQGTPEDLLLLGRSPMDLVQRAVSFGTTFLYHDAGDLTDREFAPVFHRFIENASRVMPRDIVSLAQVAAIRPELPLMPGLDVTQLFCGEADWRTAFPDGTDRSLARPDNLLCYFARGRHELADLAQAIRLFSEAFGQPVNWLGWGDNLSFPHVERYAGRLEVDDLSPGVQPRLSALLEAIAAAQCVLTDTYHVAVLAWSLGTPALIVRGDHWPHDYNAVIDKRYVFCVQHGLQDFFLDGAQDHGELAAFFRRCAKHVAEGRVLERYRMSVGRQAAVCESRLVAAIRQEESVCG